MRLVQAGVPRGQAALTVGIDDQTMRRWLREAAAAERKLEEGLELTSYENRLRAFRARLQKHEAAFEAQTVTKALASAERTDKPAVMLEVLRRHPATRERWNVPTKVDISPMVSDEPPELSVEEMAAQIERLHSIARERIRHTDDQAASVQQEGETT